MFRLQTLQGKAIVLASVFILVIVAEFLAIRAGIKQLHQNDRQSELVQSSHLLALKLSYDVQQFLQGRSDKLGEMGALMNQQDAYFQTLAQGGTEDEEIKPLSRLTQITLGRTIETWQAYKKSVIILTTHQVWKDSAVTNTEVEAEVIDSLTATPTATVTQKVVNPAVAQARTLIDGQWITFSAQFNKLIKDVREDAQKSESLLLYIVGISSLLFVLMLVGLVLLFRLKVIQPLAAIEQAAIQRQHVPLVTADETGRVAKGLNQIIDQLHEASTFVQSIGEGNLEVMYSQDQTQSSETDKLASSLVSMQRKLKSINEEEQKRKWANEGVAKFVDILRSSNDNIQTLGDSIVATLVQYTGSNQGGLYILNDEDHQNKFLELISLYAFNTKKFEQQKLRLGEGLVGQAYLEKETIYLNEIPNDYIRITSGLGEANPKAILVVPLKVDKEVYGLVELASFKDYQPHEIAFVEKLGENLASTLASVKTNQRNRKLLEDSKMAAESMHAQEEEMRQNMEELTATQEEMGRKEKDYLLKISDLEEKLNQPRQGDDWALATETERSLKMNLEALEITRQALLGKDGKP